MSTGVAESEVALHERHQMLRQKCEDALHAIEGALAGPQEALSEDAYRPERALATFRDALIEQLRQELPYRERRSTQSVLEKVNATLSVVVGVEYPIKGEKEKLMKQARKVVKGLMHRAALRVE